MEGGEKGYMRDVDGAREGQGPGTANTIARGGRERSKWSSRRVGRRAGSVSRRLGRRKDMDAE